jgi:HK97 family phage prohead protease
MENYDFSGWATRNDIRCSDGRTILRDAFKHCDGASVPLVWNHQHDDPSNVLGHALLQNREEGVYAYCTFNNTEKARDAKELVKHGDVAALSIYANQLKQQGGNVLHGSIKEVSLVLAGANPGAFIDSVISHGEGADEDAVIYTGEDIELFHAEEPEENKEEKPMAQERTIQEVYDEFTEEQKDVVHFLIGQALEDQNVEHSDEGGETIMHTNLFDQEETNQAGVLMHADQQAIIEMAKKPGVGSLREAISQYAEQNGILAHGFEAETLGDLFPEYKNLGPAAPEFLENDNSWVDYVIGKVHKSPISRIRTRQMDIRNEDFRALGYTDREIEKKKGPLMKLVKRTTDPQTVYRKDELHRDDIIDITDFDVVAYQYGVMQKDLKRELALAYLIGDGRDDNDEDKISEDHIRSIWNDEELYCLHADVDIAAMKAELQGTNTGANFGENYIYAEALIQQALYSREKYKGSGKVDLFCTPHLLNVMLLARDLNGRRIYSSKADLAAALNVEAIHTIEQFEGKVRTDKAGKKHKLLGLFVNLNDYQVGATKGGEITKFEDFDIDFNKYKYLIETRQSGALTKVFSAIALEEPASAE